MYLFLLLFILPYISTYPITYNDVRGVPYNVSYDHRAITINGNRTMLISGAIHYPRSTPGMWPYIMKMARKQGLNTIQTYVFWNLHEPNPGELNFNGRANLSRFLEEASNAGLFVNLRIGPYVCAEWAYGGLPVWLNQVPNISFRSHNAAWERLMKQFILTILDYVTPYLAKNGGPIILAQIENEYYGNDPTYIDWCGDLVTNELSSTKIPWIMCNGRTANSTIETCNSCNCVDDGWVNDHQKYHPHQPMMFTENEGLFDIWGFADITRSITDLAYSVAEWFAVGGAYHAYYMWYGGNNYGRTAGSSVTTKYEDDVFLHSDGAVNEPKYTHLSILQHLVANHAEIILSQNPTQILLPYWNGTHWSHGTEQYVYTYLRMISFVINHSYKPLNVLFRTQNISMAGQSVQIYDDSTTLLWDSANPSDILSNNTQIVPIISGPFQWQIWSEPIVSNLSVITSPCTLEQLQITNDETIYLWYRRNITLIQASARSIVKMKARKANAFLFFLDGQYLGEFDTHSHDQGPLNATIAFDLSHFKINQPYLFEILSVSLGIDNAIGAGSFDYKGIIGNVWLDEQFLCNDEMNLWEHQKGLVGEYYEIYTEQGSSQVNWDSIWTKGIDRPITWFQTRFDLDHLVREDTNANPVLLDMEGFNRGHAFINGNDLGLYWLIQGVCSQRKGRCKGGEIKCLEPTQRYYHIPSDWLMPKDNLLSIFEDLGAPSPGSISLVQRIVNN